MKINNDQASCAVGATTGILIVIHSLSYEMGSPSSPGTGFMPLLVGLAIIVFSLIGLVHTSLQSLRGVGWEPVLKDMRWQRILIALLALLAYALFLTHLGFILTTVLFVGFILRVLEGQRWLVAISWAILSAIVSYTIFEVWLHAQLPAGLLRF